MPRKKKYRKKKPDLPEIRGWVTTWKRIAIFFDVSIDTVQAWHKQGFPIMRTLSGTPMIIPEVANQWIIEFNKAENGMKTDQCFFCGQTFKKRKEKKRG